MSTEQDLDSLVEDAEEAGSGGTWSDLLAEDDTPALQAHSAPRGTDVTEEQRRLLDDLREERRLLEEARRSSTTNVVEKQRQKLTYADEDLAGELEKVYFDPLNEQVSNAAELSNRALAELEAFKAQQKAEKEAQEAERHRLRTERILDEVGRRDAFATIGGGAAVRKILQKADPSDPSKMLLHRPEYAHVLQALNAAIAAGDADAFSDGMDMYKRTLDRKNGKKLDDVASVPATGQPARGRPGTKTLAQYVEDFRVAQNAAINNRNNDTLAAWAAAEEALKKARREGVR